MMRKQWLFPCFGLVLLGFVLSACSQGNPINEIAPTNTAENSSQASPSVNPSNTTFPTASATYTPSPTVTLTPTPIYYDVLEGDDMYSIAFYYNISPQEIMTANPSVNPRAMGPGTTLVIPVTLTPEPTSADVIQQSPTSTLFFSSLPAPDCYPDSLGGLWCFVLISNLGSSAFENVTGLFVLQQGEEFRQETALTPLNLIPPGESLPLVAYFQPPVEQTFSVSASVDFYLPVMPADDRYLPVEISERNISIDEDGLAASIRGKLTITEGKGNPAYVWVCATAFDEEGHVIAVRRWESEQAIESGDQIPFEFSVFSHTGPIVSVDLSVEAYQEQTSQE